MSTRSCLITILSLFAASSVAAQTSNPPSAGGIDQRDRQWVELRVRFVRDIYALDDAQTKRVTAMMTELIPAERLYESNPDIARTLRSLRAASQNVNAATQDPAFRPRLHEKFSRQRYDWVYVAAPLSYAKVLPQVEAQLPPDKASAGRQRLRAKLAARLADPQAEIRLQQVDWLVRQPVELPSVVAGRRAVTTLPRPATRQPVKPDVATGDASGKPVKGTPTPTLPGTANPKQPRPVVGPQFPPQRAIPKRPPPRPAPPKVVAPAPPLDQWSDRIEQSIRDYGFTEQQSTKARAILLQTRKRAVDQSGRTKTAVAETEKITDAAVRQQKLKELNRPIDVLFDQLTERVKSLATTEQQQAAKKAKPASIGADATRPSAAGKSAGGDS